MKVIVVNTKGGVGKSTVAGQIVSPWLFERLKHPVTYCEYDDCNRDAETFRNTKIFQVRHRDIVTNVLSDLLAEDILTETAAVVDVGGNRTAEMVLQALDDSGVAGMVDLFVIPLMDGEQDAVNALLTYSRIREMTEAPVVFALSRYNPMRDLETQFFQFLGCRNGPMKQLGSRLQQKVPEKDHQIIVVDDDDSIVYSRVMGKTIFEVAKEQASEGPALEAELKDCVARGDREGALTCSWRIKVRKGMARYHAKVIAPALESLDQAVAQSLTDSR